MDVTTAPSIDIGTRTTIGVAAAIDPSGPLALTASKATSNVANP